MYRKIGHKSVMYIHEFFIDKDEQDHLVDQVIHDMEGMGYTSNEGVNGMDPLLEAALSVDGSTAF